MITLNSEIEAKLIKAGSCLVGFADVSVDEWMESSLSDSNERK